MAFQNDYFNNQPFPARLSFATSAVRLDELSERQWLKLRTRSYRLSRFLSREADLWIGESRVGRATVDGEGLLSVTSGAVPPLEHLEVRISASLGWAVLLPSALPVSEGAVIPLSHASADLVCVRFGGLRDGWATGELVLIGSTLGVRLVAMAPCGAGRPSSPNGVVTHVSLGSLLIDATDLDQVGEGTILGLGHPSTEPFRLISGTTPIAEGYLRSVLPGEVSTQQEWGESGPPDPETPYVAFVVTRSLLPRDGAKQAGTDVTPPSTAGGPAFDQPVSLPILLSSLAETRLFNLIEHSEPLIAGFLLKILAAGNPGAAAQQLTRALEDGNREAVVAFAVCSPADTDGSVQSLVAGHVAGLLSADELQQARVEEDAFAEASGDGLPPGLDRPVEVAAGALGLIREQLLVRAISALQDEHQELASAIRARLFLFEDIATLDDRSIQKLLREIDTADLVNALFGAAPAAMKAITRNMSKRAVEMLEEEMSYAQTPGEHTVDEARLKIRRILAKLIEHGEVVASQIERE